MNTTNNITAKNMNLDTIAFSKGFLRVDEYSTITDLGDEFLKTATELKPLVMSMQAELMRFGYMFNAECLYYLNNMSDEELEILADNVLAYLENSFGDGCFVTLFGNYPHTVMMMSEIEMFFHQIIHYLSGGTYSPAMPSCDDTELRMLHDRYDGVTFRDSYKLIKPISTADFVAYFKKILGAQQSLTSYDKEVVTYLIDNYNYLVDNVEDLLPEEVPFKETLCLLFDRVPSLYPKTVTDVLRYAVYLSGGDITLPRVPRAVDFGWGKMLDLPNISKYLRTCYENQLAQARSKFKFKKFSRAERRRILGMIEHLFEEQKAAGKHGDNILADMKKYSERWIRLAEILHPGEYNNKFPETCGAFTMLRNSAQYISTYYGRVNAARNANDIKLLVKIFTERPGEFARNIDNLLRNYPSETENIMTAFVQQALPQVSTKVIYELLDHFNVRNDVEFREGRYVVVKGARNAFSLPALPELDNEVLARLMNAFVEELSSRIANNSESLNNKTIIIDKKLVNIALPKNMRSMNITPGQIARGSVIPIKADTGIFRCYCRWIDKHGHYDLDLSTQMFDKDFKYITSISWDSYYKRENWAVFSGDVRHRQGNCAEYIDIDIAGAKNAGVRYIAACVNDYDGQGFEKKDAWAGVMERSQMGTQGEITWAPKTITTGFKLTSVCTNIIMTVIDLEKMVMYVVDEDTAGLPVASTNRGQISDVVRRYVNQKRYFNAFSLIQFNADCRGANVVGIDTDDIEKMKNSLDEHKRKFTLLKKQYEDELANIPEEGDNERLAARNKLVDNLADINLELEMLNNTEVITYDDITSDYTKLFEWMF